MYRRAINYAFDRKEMVKYLRKNMVFPGNYGIVPPELSNYKLSGFSYKPDSVERLLTNFQLEEKNSKTQVMKN